MLNRTRQTYPWKFSMIFQWLESIVVSCYCLCRVMSCNCSEICKSSPKININLAECLRGVKWLFLDLSRHPVFRTETAEGICMQNRTRQTYPWKTFMIFQWLESIDVSCYCLCRVMSCNCPEICKCSPKINIKVAECLPGEKWLMWLKGNYIKNSKHYIQFSVNL